jgi:hypothetical protein
MQPVTISKLIAFSVLALCINCQLQPRSTAGLREIFISKPRHGLFHVRKPAENSLLFGQKNVKVLRRMSKGTSISSGAASASVEYPSVPPSDGIQANELVSLAASPAQETFAAASNTLRVAPVVASGPVSQPGALFPAPADASAFVLPTIAPFVIPTLFPTLPNPAASYNGKHNFGYPRVPGQDFDGVAVTQPDGNAFYIYCHNCQGK